MATNVFVYIDHFNGQPVGSAWEIVAAARKAAEAIRRDAQRTAEQEIRSAQELLRAEVAQQALDIARRLAPQQLTTADHQRFVSDFVQQVNQ